MTNDEALKGVKDAIGKYRTDVEALLLEAQRLDAENAQLRADLAAARGQWAMAEAVSAGISKALATEHERLSLLAHYAANEYRFPVLPLTVEQRQDVFNLARVYAHANKDPKTAKWQEQS